MTNQRQPGGTGLEATGLIRETGKLATGCCSQHPGKTCFAIDINRKAFRQGLIATAQTRRYNCRIVTLVETTADFGNDDRNLQAILTSRGGYGWYCDRRYAGQYGRQGRERERQGRDSQAGCCPKIPRRKNSPGNKPVPRNRQTDVSNTDKPDPTSEQAAGKSRKKARSPTRKAAQREQVAPPAGSEASSAITATANAETANAANQTSGDSRSISWMSAQAISALNAVKASQARKAESLLARVEKPVPGRAAITELPEQTSEDLVEEYPGMEAAAPAAPNTLAPLETTTTSSPASAGDTRTTQKEATVMQDRPDEQETMAESTAAGTTPENAAEAVSISPGPEAAASTEAVIAMQSQQRGLPVRPIVATVFLALLAFSGYRYWQDNRDTGVAAPPVAGSYSETVQSADWADIPQQEAIAVVDATTSEQSAPAAPAPDKAADVAAQSDTMVTDGFANTPATETPGHAATEDTGNTAIQETAEAAQPPAAQAEMETLAPAEIIASEPPQPQTPAVVAPPARPVQPQPSYGTPGYGYYPQQPNWQQPYYQPGYPQQYPAR